MSLMQRNVKGGAPQMAGAGVTSVDGVLSHALHARQAKQCWGGDLSKIDMYTEPLMPSVLTTLPCNAFMKDT